MTNKELLTKSFTNEEYETHRLIARRYILEDLQDILRDEFDIDINALEEGTIDEIVEHYEENADNDNWYWTLRNAIRWVGIDD